MADQGTQNNEQYQSTWMPMSLPMSPYMPSPLLVSLEWLYIRKVTEPSWLEEVCVFSMCWSALTTSWPAGKVCFSSTLPSLLSYFKAEFTMLFVSRHTRSLPSEEWIRNFEVVWLHHLFRRSRVHWTRRCAIWSLWVWEWTILQT